MIGVTALISANEDLGTVPEPKKEALWLKPGLVQEVGLQRVKVDVDGRLIDAVNAISHFYQPAVGDSLLVSGQGSNYYLIGVISGKGDINLASGGNLNLRAPNGVISIESGEKVAFRTPRFEVLADDLQLRAKRVREKFEEVEATISKAYRFTANSVSKTIVGLYRLRSQEFDARASGNVKLDGKQIKLG